MAFNIEAKFDGEPKFEYTVAEVRISPEVPKEDIELLRNVLKTGNFPFLEKSNADKELGNKTVHESKKSLNLPTEKSTDNSRTDERKFDDTDPKSVILESVKEKLKSAYNGCNIKTDLDSFGYIVITVTSFSMDAFSISPISLDLGYKINLDKNAEIRYNTYASMKYTTQIDKIKLLQVMGILEDNTDGLSIGEPTGKYKRGNVIIFSYPSPEFSAVVGAIAEVLSYSTTHFGTNDSYNLVPVSSKSTIGKLIEQKTKERATLANKIVRNTSDNPYRNLYESEFLKNAYNLDEIATAFNKFNSWLTTKMEDEKLYDDADAKDIAGASTKTKKTPRVSVASFISNLETHVKECKKWLEVFLKSEDISEKCLAVMQSGNKGLDSTYIPKLAASLGVASWAKHEVKIREDALNAFVLKSYIRFEDAINSDDAKDFISQQKGISLKNPVTEILTRLQTELSKIEKEKRHELVADLDALYSKQSRNTYKVTRKDISQLKKFIKNSIENGSNTVRNTLDSLNNLYTQVRGLPAAEQDDIIASWNNSIDTLVIPKDYKVLTMLANQEKDATYSNETASDKILLDLINKIVPPEENDRLSFLDDIMFNDEFNRNYLGKKPKELPSKIKAARYIALKYLSSRQRNPNLMGDHYVPTSEEQIRKNEGIKKLYNAILTLGHTDIFNRADLNEEDLHLVPEILNYENGSDNYKYVLDLLKYRYQSKHIPDTEKTVGFYHKDKLSGENKYSSSNSIVQSALSAEEEHIPQKITQDLIHEIDALATQEDGMLEQDQLDDFSDFLYDRYSILYDLRKALHDSQTKEESKRHYKELKNITGKGEKVVSDSLDHWISTLESLYKFFDGLDIDIPAYVARNCVAFPTNSVGYLQKYLSDLRKKMFSDKFKSELENLRPDYDKISDTDLTLDDRKTAANSYLDLISEIANSIENSYEKDELLDILGKMRVKFGHLFDASLLDKFNEVLSDVKSKVFSNNN